jgi:hypothetical protein
MLASLLGLAAMAPQAAPTALAPAYDTFLDSALPDVNFGRDAGLVAGSGKVLLVRFPGIGWRLDPERKVSEARIEFRILAGGPVRLKSIGRVLRPWGEGTGRRLLPSGRQSPAPWAATWNSARNGADGERWGSGGASGAGDWQPFEGASLVQNDDRVLVTGIGPLVQAALTHPDLHYGWRIEFEGETTFGSSEIPEIAPRLLVTQTTENLTRSLVATPVESVVKDGKAALRSKLRNSGDEELAGMTAVWHYRHKPLLRQPIEARLAAGETLVVSVESPAAGNAADQPVLLTVEGPAGVLAASAGFVGASSAAAPETWFADGRAAALARLLNDEAMPFSRYSFCPDGVPARFQPVAGESLAADAPAAASAAARALLAASPFGAPPPEAGAFAFHADTRDDAFLPPSRWRPDFRWTPPDEGDPVMPARGWLGPGEALALTMPMASTAHSVIVRLVGFDGKTLGGATVQAFTGDESGPPAFEAEASPDGTLRFQSAATPDSWPTYSLVVRRGAAVARVGLPAWRYLVEAARLPKGQTPIVEVGAMLLSERRDEDDLAAGRPVETGDGKLPAVTALAVDADPATSVEVKPGGWIEVDIGRDRSLAEIVVTFEGAVPDRFEASLGRTGSPLRTRWFVEAFGQSRADAWGKGSEGRTTLRYSATPTPARFLRIANTGTSAVRIATLQVFPLPSS